MGGNRSFGPRCIYLSGGRLSFSNRGACEIVSFWFGPTATCVAGSLIREVSGIANMAVTAPSSEDTSARMLVGDGDVIIRGSRQQYSTSRLASDGEHLTPLTPPPRRLVLRPSTKTISPNAGAAPRSGSETANHGTRTRSATESQGDVQVLCAY
mmetsp:Transcript_27898/g.66439  ORF Transcript_27898/g.66439 Transcript_27898/m.66439 type:complete len:154 (-) Transcript_27898:75-536(-)